MKFTLSWLREHLETSASIQTISETLTAIGLEVESITDHSAALAPFIVAEIMDAIQHPNADKLRVCQVNDGSSVRQVVCGAPNARKGIKVVLAREGDVIPANGMVIKKSAIRSVESNGMLCSAAELGLGEDGGGIIELPASAVIGSPAAEALGANDPVIDIAITPNRADCLSVSGVARDLAAAGLGTFKAPKIPAVSYGAASPVSVTLATENCPMFVGCLISGVKNGESPDWLKQRLTAIGLRPISALVDITNYMTFAYGRPLHVFDADKLRGNITVRMAKDGETLAALNDKDYTLTDGMITVCDDSGVLALGGIMGGISTGCSAETTNVFLESAFFDPLTIARTGRALAIDSDARYRFERGVDPAFVQQGAEIAIAMILELCGGSASKTVIAGSEPEWKRSIAFDTNKVASLGGVSLPDARIHEILHALGFSISGNHVTPPSWRADIHGEADLVEEVIRIAGFHSIPVTALPAVMTKVVPSVEASRISTMRKLLATRGSTEICSFSFIEEASAKLFSTDIVAPKLKNPINQELSVMRPNLLPNLIAAAKRNHDRGVADVAFFEAGNVFLGTTPADQKIMLAGIRSGHAIARNIFKTERSVDIFDAKADLFAVLETAGLNPAKLAITTDASGWYHPARSARISLGGKVTLGMFGELHPAHLEALGHDGAMVGFEVYLDAVPVPRTKGTSKPLLHVSKFPVVTRDFAFVAAERLLVQDVVRAIEGAEKQLIQSVDVFDIYSGKGMEAGKKSIALSVALQASDRTLNEQEIDTAVTKILAAALKLGLVLRQ